MDRPLLFELIDKEKCAITLLKRLIIHMYIHPKILRPALSNLPISYLYCKNIYLLP